MPKFELIRMEGLRTFGRQVEANTWREAEQQCRHGEIVNGELIGVYDCDPVTEAVCTARNDVMIERRSRQKEKREACALNAKWRPGYFWERFERLVREGM